MEQAIPHTGALDIDRRGLLAGAAAFAGASTLFTSKALSAEKVFLNYTQEELDRNYDQRPWAPNMGKVLGRLALRSQLVRERLGEPKKFSYGPTDRETLDLFRTGRENAPIHIFIHGGAWRVGSAKNSAFHAEKYVAAGAHFIALDFAPVMEVGLDGMADQCRRAIAWVYKNAESFGGDKNRIYISGHSSGGHLAGVMTITDWNGMFGVPADIIKGAVCMSGMYDLKAVRLSARSSYVPFTDAIEHDYSAIRHLDRINCPIIVAYAEFDTDDFRRQSVEFADALAKIDRLQKVIVAKGYNHFEIMESLADPFGIVGYEALRQMA